MPATFTRTPAEVERKDPGIGGKPPVDRRPTGGGGGDENWDNRFDKPKALSSAAVLTMMRAVGMNQASFGVGQAASTGTISELES